jgi:hypothetical protein
MKKHRVSDYWNMGSSIGLCAAIGIVLGAASKFGSMAMHWRWYGRGSRSGFHAV